MSDTTPSGGTPSLTRAKLDWFKAVILPHQNALRGRLLRVAKPHQDVDDLVSEVLARAYANERWQDVTYGRAYLFTIARNLVIDEARRNRVVSFDQIADVDLLQATGDFEAQLSAREELRWLQKAMSDLPPQSARAFYMARVQEKSMRDVAVSMNLSVSTVEKHLSKALRLLTRARAERNSSGQESPTATAEKRLAVGGAGPGELKIEQDTALSGQSDRT